LVADINNIHLLYFKNKASMRTIDTRALSVKLLVLHPTFCSEEKDIVPVVFYRIVALM